VLCCLGGEHLVITERSCWCGFGTDQRTYGTNANRLSSSSNEIFGFRAPSSLIWLLSWHARSLHQANPAVAPFPQSVFNFLPPSPNQKVHGRSTLSGIHPARLAHLKHLSKVVCLPSVMTVPLILLNTVTVLNPLWRSYSHQILNN